ncbi:Peroxiredoxin [Pedobacter sp. ok626]|uniref:TlpA disulfide reductase family protein n=1 Tax=Pedobacter sp. ok626 TaxID=1761882 RepID=UPI00088429EC|nr:TlpA disulfide reductase family protein [Pedobacter sp. ok626]SDK65434.1 Peroxiredoxin [Pedobacter sp. ok626]
MNKLIAIAVAVVLPTLVNAQAKYSITGRIPKTNTATAAVMSYPPDDKGGEYKADTAKIVNGKFEFKGTIRRPQMAELNLIVPRPAAETGRRNQSNENQGMKNVALFYLDGKIDITFDTAGIAAYAGGGKEQKAWEFYSNEAANRSKAQKEPAAGMEFFEVLVSDMVKRYPDSYVSVDLMDLFTQSSIQPKLVEPMYNALSKRMQQSEKVLAWKPKLDQAKLAVSGNVTAPDFTLNDTEGKPISLASYRGGYVLVDFWASWCVPCRAENPNVLAAYEKFKDKNFKILGISLDEKKDLWLKAIAEDKLPWKQVCDFKASRSEVTKAYNISSIPANVLVDPNGKIVGKDLRGKDLHDRLAELIK